MGIGDLATRALKEATQTVPIVGAAEDMVEAGLVASLSRPGGNVTGISMLSPELDGKRLDILIEAAPNARRIAALADGTQTPQSHTKKLQDWRGRAASSFRFSLLPGPGDSDGDRRCEGVGRRSRQRSGLGTAFGPSPSHHRAHGDAAPAGDIPMARNRGTGRLRGLRTSLGSDLPPAGADRCQDIARCQTCRHSRRAADPIRAGDQSDGSPRRLVTRFRPGLVLRADTVIE